MSEQTSQENTESQSTGSSTGEAWEAVGQSFRVLGESLAEAFRSTINNEENRHHVDRMQEGVDAMIREVEQAIKDSASSPEIQKFHDEAVKTMHTIRDTSEDTVQEIRPHLLSALERVSDEIQHVIEGLKTRENEAATKTEDDSESM